MGFNLQTDISLAFHYWFSFHSQVLNCPIHFLPFFVYIFNHLIMGFICFLLKDFYHLHLAGFKHFFLYFSFVRILRNCCDWVTGLLWRHLVPDVIDCVFILKSLCPGFGKLYLDAAFYSCTVSFLVRLALDHHSSSNNKETYY